MKCMPFNQCQKKNTVNNHVSYFFLFCGLLVNYLLILFLTNETVVVLNPKSSSRLYTRILPCFYHILFVFFLFLQLSL